MKFAIKPRGIGKKPGARAIEDHFPLAAGETFTVSEAGYSPQLVLSEDSVSLRAKTPEELTLEAAAAVAAVIEQDAQEVHAADVRADAIFTALKAATPAQIGNFINTRFPDPAFTAPQRQVFKIMLQQTALSIRHAG